MTTKENIPSYETLESLLGMEESVSTKTGDTSLHECDEENNGHNDGKIRKGESSNGFNHQESMTFLSRYAFQIKYYKDLNMSRSFDDFSARVAKFLSHLGFAQYALSRVNAFGNRPVPIITSPHEMMDIYINEKMYQHDLVPQIIIQDNSPLFQSLIEDHVTMVPFRTTAIIQNREICKLIRSFGFADFYYIPLGARNGRSRIMLAVSTDHDDLGEFRAHIENCKAILHALAEAMDYIGTRKFPDIFLENAEDQEIAITPKPLVLLQTLAQEDLTLAQAADRLCISVHTANKHIAAARLALGTQTIQGAIYTAIKEGLIECKQGPEYH